MGSGRDTVHSGRALIHMSSERADGAGRYHGEESVMELLREAAKGILQGHSQGDDDDATAAMSHTARLTAALQSKAKLLNASSEVIYSDTMRWVNRGGPWRAWLATAIAAILLLALTGFGIFLLFFLVATANAVAIAFLGSLASVGAFIGIFFTSLVAIYIGALLVSAFAISVLTLATLGAVLITAGWVCFFWCMWRGFQTFVDFIRGTLIVAASVLAPISTTGSVLAPVSATGSTQIIGERES